MQKATFVNYQSAWVVELIVVGTFAPKVSQKFFLGVEATNPMLFFFAHIDCVCSCIHCHTYWIQKFPFTISFTAEVSDEFSFQRELLDSVVGVVCDIKMALTVNSDIVRLVELSRL